jgi:hypothetical protein
MGPKPTWSLAVLVGVVAVFGSVCPAAAQNFPPNPLAVRMPDNATALDVKAVVAIAIRMGVPLGFEEVGALAEEVNEASRGFARNDKQVFTRKDRRVFSRRDRRVYGARRTPPDVRALTLGDALEAAVAKDGRYAWQVVDGVVVVRPVAAWTDPSHPLVPLIDQLNATVRARGRSHWILERSSSKVLLDRGRAVEVVEPVLRVVDEAGEETIPLRSR